MKLTIEIPETTYARLKALATKRGRPVATLVKVALYDGLATMFGDSK